MRILILMIFIFGCGKKGSDNRTSSQERLGLGDEQLLSKANVTKLLGDKIPLLASTKVVPFQIQGNTCKTVTTTNSEGVVSFAESTNSEMVYSNRPYFYLKSSDPVLVCEWSKVVDAFKVSKAMSMFYGPFYLENSNENLWTSLYSISSLSNTAIDVASYMFGTTAKPGAITINAMTVDSSNDTKLSLFSDDISNDTISENKTTIKLVRSRSMTLDAASKIMYVQSLVGTIRFASDKIIQKTTLGQSQNFVCPKNIATIGSDNSFQEFNSCDELTAAVKTQLAQPSVQNIFVLASNPSLSVLQSLLDLNKSTASTHTLNLNFTNADANKKVQFEDRLMAHNFSGSFAFQKTSTNGLGLTNSNDSSGFNLGDIKSPRGSLADLIAAAAKAATSSLVNTLLPATSDNIPSTSINPDSVSNSDSQTGSCDQPGIGKIISMKKEDKDADAKVYVAVPRNGLSYLVNGVIQDGMKILIASVVLVEKPVQIVPSTVVYSEVKIKLIEADSVLILLNTQDCANKDSCVNFLVEPGTLGIIDKDSVRLNGKDSDPINFVDVLSVSNAENKLFLNFSVESAIQIAEKDFFNAVQVITPFSDSLFKGYGALNFAQTKFTIPSEPQSTSAFSLHDDSNSPTASVSCTIQPSEVSASPYFAGTGKASFIDCVLTQKMTFKKMCENFQSGGKPFQLFSFLKNTKVQEKFMQGSFKDFINSCKNGIMPSPTPTPIPSDCNGTPTTVPDVYIVAQGGSSLSNMFGIASEAAVKPNTSSVPCPKPTPTPTPIPAPILTPTPTPTSTIKCPLGATSCVIDPIHGTSTYCDLTGCYTCGTHGCVKIPDCTKINSDGTCDRRNTSSCPDGFVMKQIVTDGYSTSICVAI